MAIAFPREGLVIAPDANKTLLEILEAKGYPANYQCRAGYCGSCKLPIQAGSVRYVIKPLAYTEAGEVLPCACQPMTAVTLPASVAREWFGDQP